VYIIFHFSFFRLTIVILTVTINMQSMVWYDVDLLILAFSMIFVAVATMVIAIRTSFHIQSSSMFESISNDDVTTSGTATSSIILTAKTNYCALLSCGLSQWLYELFFTQATGMHGMQMQVCFLRFLLIFCFILLLSASFGASPCWIVLLPFRFILFLLLPFCSVLLPFGFILRRSAPF
jgi:hypothetical protein